MYEITATDLILSLLVTWCIGLAPPLFVRFLLLKGPMNKGPAIGVCIFLWFINIVLFTALGSQSKSHGALILVALASYWILRKALTVKELASPSKDGVILDKAPSWWSARSKLFRMWIFGSITWSTAILLFVIGSEPYGSRIDDDESFQMLFIMFVPPLFVGAATYGYNRWIK